MEYIIVMLIWVGSVHGGPTTIQGFETLQDCQNQIKTVEAEMEELVTEAIFMGNSDTDARCIKIPSGKKSTSE